MSSVGRDAILLVFISTVFLVSFTKFGNTPISDVEIRREEKVLSCQIVEFFALNLKDSSRISEKAGDYDIIIM